jgi:hypothetical protein
MNNYTFCFLTDKSSKEIFDLILDVDKWWSGIFGETIAGNSRKIGDEFTFSAGEGMHFSKQKLVELVPYKKIVWEVTESNLSFLGNPKEWENTKLTFDILEDEGKTQIQFMHMGLEPQNECYGGCSTAWTQYFKNLEQKLNNK